MLAFSFIFSVRRTFCKICCASGARLLVVLFFSFSPSWCLVTCLLFGIIFSHFQPTKTAYTTEHHIYYHCLVQYVYIWFVQKPFNMQVSILSRLVLLYKLTIITIVDNITRWSRLLWTFLDLDCFISAYFLKAYVKQYIHIGLFPTSHPLPSKYFCLV